MKYNPWKPGDYIVPDYDLDTVNWGPVDLGIFVVTAIDGDMIEYHRLDGPPGQHRAQTFARHVRAAPNSTSFSGADPKAQDPNRGEAG